jgi:hypothetical protein
VPLRCPGPGCPCSGSVRAGGGNSSFRAWLSSCAARGCLRGYSSKRPRSGVFRQARFSRRPAALSARPGALCQTGRNPRHPSLPVLFEASSPGFPARRTTPTPRTEGA